MRALLGSALPPALLVTAHDDQALGPRARAAGFNAVLAKPITASGLHDELVRVLQARAEHEEVQLAPRQGEAESQLLALHDRRRVLLVEDNPINQEVASELLASANLAVTIAENGARAVELTAADRFDLILMDVQMPVMDGLAATRALRARDGDATPIIAMTANAFGEDREACLAAGMNDHVAKPVDLERLYGRLLRWLPPAPPATTAPAAAPAEDAPAPAARAPLRDRLAAVEGFDVDAALRNVGGRIDMLERVLRRFVATYRGGDPGLAQAASVEPNKAWLAACHSLRGACAVLGASLLPPQLAAFEQELRVSSALPALAAQARQMNAELIALVERLVRELAD